MHGTLKSALFATAVAVGLALPVAARADSVNVLLTPGTQSAAPGSIITFSGTISAPATNAAPIYIDGGDPTFFGPSDISVDAGDLLNFFDPISANGSVSGDLFTVTIPTGEMAGSYSGTVYVLGGATLTSTDPIGQINFNVNVAAPTAATPEPSSYLLLASGLLGVFALVRRQRSLSA